MSAKFSAYIGIDYSGAATPMSRSATIQVYEGCGNSDPGLVLSPASATNKHRNWNRFEVADWLTERLSRDDRCIVGIDHGFSFPVSYFERNKIKSWAEFLDDFVQHLSLIHISEPTRPY